MESVSCVLFLVERDERVHRGLNKALLLARHFGAPLELLLCDTQHLAFHAGADAQARERACVAGVAEGGRYLQALRQTIVSAGVEIGAEAVCMPSLTQGLADKLRRTPAQTLVVKSGRAGAGLVGPVERQLLERCPVPLLLTRGRPWRASARFAAVLDLGERADGRLGAQIVALCEALASRCGAELEYLYADPLQAHSERAAGEAHRRLAAHRRGAHPGIGRLQYCSGAPAEVLPRLLSLRDYDLLVLGSVPRAPPREPYDLSAALLQAVAGDVLLIPVGADVPDIGMLARCVAEESAR